MKENESKRHASCWMRNTDDATRQAAKLAKRMGVGLANQRKRSVAPEVPKLDWVPAKKR